MKNDDEKTVKKSAKEEMTIALTREDIEALRKESIEAFHSILEKLKSKNSNGKH